MMRPTLRIAFVACLAALAVTAGAVAQKPAASRAAQPASLTRSYAMGLAPTAPVMTTASVLATAQAMAPVSEYALIQREVPWPTLLAGGSISAELDNEQPFIDYLRSLSMKIVWLVDPLDGLDRTKEPPDLVAAGRSLREPQILAMHEDWVRAVAQRFHPEHFGLASEVNTLAAHGDQTLYGVIVNMVNALTPDIHSLDPAATVFISFQMEDAWQHAPFPPSAIDQFQLIQDFHVDALGLSSYPSFGFPRPADIPDDYYQRFVRATPLPLLQVEGGWSSVASAWGSGSPADQAAYVDRIGALLDGVRARLWVTLIYADLNLADPSWNLPPDRQAELQNFASQGMTTSDFQPKPAYAEWKLQFDRPRSVASVGGVAQEPEIGVPPDARTAPSRRITYFAILAASLLGATCLRGAVLWRRGQPRGTIERSTKQDAP